jgi:hypothetical protein
MRTIYVSFFGLIEANIKVVNKDMFLFYIYIYILRLLIVTERFYLTDSNFWMGELGSTYLHTHTHTHTHSHTHTHIYH